MPTNRRRTTRNRGSNLSLQMRGLFEVGCGWNHYPEQELQTLWNEHGPDFLKTRTFENMSWAESMLGKPKEL